MEKKFKNSSELGDRLDMIIKYVRKSQIDLVNGFYRLINSNGHFGGYKLLVC